jgi:type I restriction enzyme, S subunit
VIAGLKPYAEYKDSGLPWLASVPAHWRIVRNGSLFGQRSQTGFAELPILEVSLKTGVQVRAFGSTKRKQVMSDHAKYKRAAKGDLAYNTMRMWQGALGVCPVDGLVSPAYVVARPYAGVEARYFAALFRTGDYMAEIDAASRGIVKDRNRLYWDQFKQMQSPCPPPDEQAAIVRFLDWANDRLDRAIRAKRKVIALLMEQKQAIVRRAVTQGLDPAAALRPTGDPWLGEIPAHWEVWRISRFARVGNGSTPSRAKPTYWNGGTYPWLNSSQVNRGCVDSSDQFITASALRECHLPKVPPGSLLVAITGQGKTRGMSARLDIEATINQHVAYITPRLPVASTDYLHLALTAAYPQLRAISDDSGSTKGALTCEDLKRLKIALPPPGEQDELVARVRAESRSLSEAIDRLEREVDLLREYRTRLIADLVAGKLDIREAAARLPDEAAPGLETEPNDDAEDSKLIDEEAAEA